MTQELKHLGDAELEIMQAVWRAGEPVQSSYIQQALRSRRDWPLPAVLTALNRLVEKGFLTCERRGRGNRYAPAVSEEAYREFEGRGFLQRLYGNSFPALVAALYRGRAIGREELSDLRRFLDELEGEEEK